MELMGEILKRMFFDLLEEKYFIILVRNWKGYFLFREGWRVLLLEVFC